MANNRRTRQPTHPSQALAQQPSVIPGITLLSASDLHYFNEGTHSRLYEKLGAHPLTVDAIRGNPVANRASGKALLPRSGPARCTNTISARSMGAIVWTKPTRMAFAMKHHP